MAKIFFLNPPFRDQRFSRSQRSPGVIKSGTMYYPYWLAHAAALCEKHGHEIFLADAPAAGKTIDDIAAQLLSFSPTLLVIETSTPSFIEDIAAATALVALQPEMKICLVGSHATSEWSKTLQEAPAVSFIAIGEYDFTILDLAHALDRGDTDFLTIAALAFRDETNVPRRGASREPIENVDELPWIAPLYKRFLRAEDYLFTLAQHPMVMLIGGRGCEARCFYCVYPQVMHGHSYRVRSPEHLVGEMKWIQDNMPEVKEIVFEDDTFTANRAWAKDVANKVKEMGVRLPFFANIRTNVDYETLAALRESGLRECATGFESGDNTILANMRKGQTIEMQQRFIEHARKLKLLVHGCFMVGFPGESPETLEKTLQLALELSPDSAQFYPVMPYPGTGAYQWAKDNGYLATENFEEWLTKDGGHRCVMNLPGLSAERLEAFCERAYRTYHFRPRYLARKLLQCITSPREGWRSFTAGLNFLRYLFSTKREEERSFLRAEIPSDPAFSGQRIRVPFGRMERMQQARSATGSSPETILAAEEASRRL